MMIQNRHGLSKAADKMVKWIETVWTPSALFVTEGGLDALSIFRRQRCESKKAHAEFSSSS
jgi:hypothetical protein